MSSARSIRPKKTSCSTNYAQFYALQHFFKSSKIQLQRITAGDDVLVIAGAVPSRPETKNVYISDWDSLNI